jgi:hypothetical protein
MIAHAFYILMPWLHYGIEYQTLLSTSVQLPESSRLVDTAHALFCVFWHIAQTGIFPVNTKTAVLRRLSLVQSGACASATP